MIRAREIIGWGVEATDAELGRLADVLINEETWEIRYFVVDTSTLFAGSKFLVSPIAVREPLDKNNKIINLRYTKKDFEKAPEASKRQPIGGELKQHVADAYGWPESIADVFRFVADPGLVKGFEKDIETTLRSSSELIGYNVEKSDEDIGKAIDLVFDNDCHPWKVSSLCVDKSNLLATAAETLIFPKSIKEISWIDKNIHVL